MRFQVGARQYASSPVPSSTSRSARFADAARARAELRVLDLAAAAPAARRAHPAKSLRLERPPDALHERRRAPGSSRSAGAMNATRSCGAGRCMPGMRTSPPSGIAPMPYSMPLRLTFTIAGGKPT